MSPIIKKGTSSSSPDPLIFKGSKFDKDAIMGRAYNTCVLPINECMYYPKIEDINKRINNSEALQEELDRYLLCIHMDCQNIQLQSKYPLELFVTSPLHTFSVDDLPDIGSFISRLVICQNDISGDLMSRLIHYSMPYIKHNRMNFPAYSPEHAFVLPDIINIILACCLALYSENSKKPLLVLRVKLFATFHDLKARGSPMDLYIFCISNMSLLRISMIEYFVYFISSFMPNETQMLTQVFGLHQDIDEIFKQFTIICDSFRYQCLQTDTLDMNDINLKSQIAIDKCNRVCKGKSRNSMRNADRKTEIIQFTPSVIQHAMKIPKISHVAYSLKFDANCDLFLSYQCKQIQSWITLHSLPKNITQKQVEVICHHVHQDTVNVMTSIYLHICLSCVANNVTNLDTKMRVMANGSLSCTNCMHGRCVVSISCVGRIVSIRSKKFYYCHQCLRVHVWNSKGTEFHSCEFGSHKVDHTQKIKSCQYCTRSNTVETINILDDKLGVLQEVALCAKHMPLQHRIKYIDNLESLRIEVSNKIKKVF